jgi:hypothetical protein
VVGDASLARIRAESFRGTMPPVYLFGFFGVLKRNSMMIPVG